MAFAARPVFIKQWMTTTLVAGTAMQRTRTRRGCAWARMGGEKSRFGGFPTLGTSTGQISIQCLSAQTTSTLEPGSDALPGGRRWTAGLRPVPEQCKRMSELTSIAICEKW